MGKAEQQFEHLTYAQIEHYGDRASGEGPNQNGLEIDQAIETHLAACDGCRIRVLEFHRSRFGLMSDPSPSAPSYSESGSQGDPDSSRSAQTGSISSLSPTNLDLLYLGRSDEHRPTPDCPTADALRDLAAGLSSADAPRFTQHAAQCHHCGPILRAYTEDFSDDLSPEDEAVLSQLKSSSPQWQKKMAQQMAAAVAPVSATDDARVAQPGSPASPVLAGRGELPPGLSTKSTSSTSRPGFFRLKWILAPVAVAATAVIAFFIWNTQRTTPEKVEKLVAQAFTEDRTTEMRLPGAAWGPVRTTRGSGSFSTPLPLLEAADSIQQQSQKTLNRTDWLNARAQAEILSGNPSQELLQDLTIGIQQHPDSIPLLFDLAAAYFKVGEINSDSNYYLQSKAALDKILQRFPSNSTALFNRALVEERLAMRDAAMADLTVSLASEQDPAWADEARRRLGQLKQLN